MKKISILAAGLAIGYMLTRLIKKLNIEAKLINNNETGINEEETGELERNITDEIMGLLNNNPEIMEEDTTSDNNTLDDIFSNKNVDFPDVDEIQEDSIDSFDDLVRNLKDVFEDQEDID